MLRSLSIRDFVIVDRMELEFAPGFTVLTGETGAGKSILIDALALVLGARADAIVVRQDAERAEIGAEFVAAGRRNVLRWLADNDLAGDEDACLMRRVIDAGGRSRGYINGRPATLAQLRELGELLVDIHGQHEHQSLLRAGAQRELLDDYGGLAESARKVAELYNAWQQRREQRVAFEADAAAFAAERERLEWQVRELAALIWQLPDGSMATSAFEAEVIWSDEHIDTLSASTLNVSKRMIDQKYEGSARHWANDEGYNTPSV
jgi:DNA repair protein RecN (Recombination protein N)